MVPKGVKFVPRNRDVVGFEEELWFQLETRGKSRG